MGRVMVGMGKQQLFLIGFFFFGVLSSAQAGPKVYRLSLSHAEQKALAFSNLLKSAVADEQAAQERAESAFSSLLPKLSLQGYVNYVTTVPVLTLNRTTTLQLASNTSYSIGPVLTYTLWDTNGLKNSYRGAQALADSKRQDRLNQELQVLYAVRSSYVRVQLLLEEMRLVQNSLFLAQAQKDDISRRFSAGAAARVDLLTARRSALNFQLQFKQRQSDLAVAFKDFLSQIGDEDQPVSQPGPKPLPGVGLVIELDGLEKLLSRRPDRFGAVSDGAQALPPDLSHPRIQAQENAVRGLELEASSQEAQRWPKVQLSAQTTMQYPNGPVFQTFNQNTFGATISMPLLIGDPTGHLVAQKKKEAESARYRMEQVRINLQRDFVQARELLQSLQEQRKLASEDVIQSEEASKLYYKSYRRCLSFS